MAEKTNPQLLRMWRLALLNTVRSSEKDLTMRQVAVLTTIYMTEPPHTVRGLATELNVAKPVITRAIDTLSVMGLVKRKRDDQDKRNVLIQRTVKGAVYLSELSDRIIQAEKESLGIADHDGTENYSPENDSTESDNTEAGIDRPLEEVPV